jgi:hypothetical protein
MNIVNCVICENKIAIINTLIPQICLIDNGFINSHRICQLCWWNPINGFGLEHILHNCPGCAVKKPYNKIYNNFIDLTDK